MSTRPPPRWTEAALAAPPVTPDGGRPWITRLVPVRQMQGRSRMAVMAVAIAMVLATGVLDGQTSRNLSLGLLYLIPVIGTTTLVSARAGTAVALFSTCVTFVADIRLTEASHPYLLTLLNSLLRLVIMMIVVGLLSAMRQAFEAARASEVHSREFLGSAAHQLRTPLSGISTTAEALLLQGARPDQERLLSRLAGEAQRAGKLVQALLRVSRLDLGEPMPAVAVDVAQLCEEELVRFRAMAPHLKIELGGRSGNGTGAGNGNDSDNGWAPPPAMALANADGVREVLANLLDNASRHAASHVTVRVRSVPDTVHITVADDGDGVPQGAEERIFERFVSLDSGRGSGLGLAIARGIATANHGRLVYHDRMFELTLPAAGPPQRPQ